MASDNKLDKAVEAAKEEIRDDLRAEATAKIKSLLKDLRDTRTAEQDAIKAGNIVQDKIDEVSVKLAQDVKDI